MGQPAQIMTTLTRSVVTSRMPVCKNRVPTFLSPEPENEASVAELLLSGPNELGLVPVD